MMDFHYRLLRITTDAIIGKIIRDIRNDTSRGIRKAIDLGSAFAKGERQKEFFHLASDVAASPRNPYNRLITRAVHTIDDSLFKTIGVNLGLTSFTYGVQQIRKQYAKTGRPVCWLREFDYSDPKKMAGAGNLESHIEDCFHEGVYAFAIHLGACRGALLWMLQVAARYPEATFLFLADPACIGTEEAEKILAVKNTAVLLHVNDTPADEGKQKEAFGILRQQHLLYGFLFSYGAGEKADLSPDFLAEMIACGCFAGVYAQAGTADANEAQTVYHTVCASRTQGTQPVLLFDYPRDAEYVQDLILQKCHFSPLNQ